jgi:hypothetical protein
MPRFIPGIAAGALADIFLEDNERVTKSTDETLNTLAQLVVEGVKKRRKKLDSVEESMSRLEALGFKRPVAASIARGGLYAVNDAVTAAGKARDFGEDVNSYYVTQAKYNPDEFADYTRAEMAEAIVPVSNIKESADILTKGKRINTDRVNEAVGKYVGATPEASSIDVPVFAQDVSKMGSGISRIQDRNTAGNYLKKLIHRRAEREGTTKSGMDITTSSTGQTIGAISNDKTYGEWIAKTLPDILAREKEGLNKTDRLLLDQAAKVYMIDNAPKQEGANDTNANRFADTSSKVIPRAERPRDPNKVKTVILEGLDAGESFENLKAEAVNDGVSADLFEQLYTEITGQSAYHRKLYGPRVYTPPKVQ